MPDTVADDEDVIVNLFSLVDSDKKLTLGVNDLTLSRNSNTGVSYSVEIPSGTVIQGESNWNGLITVPTVKANTEVTVTSGTPDLVVEVGSTGVKLTFDKAVKLVLPGKAGKSAGYAGSDDVFNTIDVCTASEVADPNTLSAEEDCYTTSGNDMIIWTKHFTKFVSYTPSSESSSGTGSEDNGGGGGNAPAPITGTGLVNSISGNTAQPLPEIQTAGADQDEGGEVQEESSNQITGAAVGTTNKTSIILVSVVVGLAALGLVFQRFSKKLRFGKKGIF